MNRAVTTISGTGIDFDLVAAAGTHLVVEAISRPLCLLQLQISSRI